MALRATPRVLAGCGRWGSSPGEKLAGPRAWTLPPNVHVRGYLMASISPPASQARSEQGPPLAVTTVPLSWQQARRTHAKGPGRVFNWKPRPTC